MRSRHPLPDKMATRCNQPCLDDSSGNDPRKPSKEVCPLDGSGITFLDPSSSPLSWACIHLVSQLQFLLVTSIRPLFAA
jgi:hypothetical protein